MVGEFILHGMTVLWVDELTYPRFLLQLATVCVITYLINTVSDLVESTKTTSMEDVSSGALEKNKEYLRSKDKAKK